MTPTKEQILERANEQYHKDNAHICTNPEESELRESGYLFSAQAELMLSEKRKNSQWLDLDKTQTLDKETQETESLMFDVNEAMASGIFISGTSGSGKTNLAFHFAKKLMQHGVVVFTLDPSQAWQNSSIPTNLTIPQPTQPTQINWKAESTIFDISTLYVKDQRKFTEQFCQAIFTAATNGFNPKIFIFFEDAQLYIPNHGLRANVFQEVMRLITCGRNYNIRFGLITQFASMVDKTAIKMCKQRYFGWTNEKNDLAYLKNFLGNRASELETLATGQFLYDYGNTTKRMQTQKFQMAYQPSNRKAATFQKKKGTIA